MDNDNKIVKPRKPRLTKEEKLKIEEETHQKAKEDILAAAEDVITMKSEEQEDLSGERQNDVHHQVSVLLENELTRISRDDFKQTFDIETEYAKAKKNSVKFAWTHMWSRLLLCVGVVLLMTFILVKIVSEHNNKIPVNVKGFENVKLTEILSDADKIDSKIAAEEERKAELEKLRSEEILKVEENYTKDKERIENNYNQEKKKIERNFTQEKKKIETSETKGWLESRSREKNLDKNEKKRLDSIAANEKRHKDNLAASKAKYREDLARAKNMYKTEIDACVSNIKKYNEDRYRFNADKVKLEDEYEGKLKDRDILHKREIDDQHDEYENKLKNQQEYYELLLEKAKLKLEETIASDMDRENNRVEETIKSYDPEVSKDSRVKKLLKLNGIDYRGTVSKGKYILLKDGASDSFRKSLENQKTIYDDIDYISRLFDRMPHKENNAIISYVKALQGCADNAGNELALSSVNEINRLIDEKNRIQYEKETVITEKKQLQSEYTVFLNSVLSEKVGTESVCGVVIAKDSVVGYKLHIAPDAIAMFGKPEYKDHVFPCTLYRNSIKVAIGNLEMKGKGNVSLVNTATGGGFTISVGDRIVMGQPYKP